MTKTWARLGGLLLLALGLTLGVLSLGLPAHFAFVDSAQLRLAGQPPGNQPAPRADAFDIVRVSTPMECPSDLLELTRVYLAQDLTGPAELLIAASNTPNLPPAEVTALRTLLRERLEQNPNLRMSGGPSPFFDALRPLLPVQPKRSVQRKVLPLLAPELNRERAHAFLQKSDRPAVAAILDTRRMTGTTRFFPAANPGGAPLDAAILTTALLLQGDHYAEGDRAQVIQLAELARRATAGDLAAVSAMEEFYQGILRLGRFLNWRQLAEMARHSDDLAHLPRLAHLAREQPENSALLFSALLLSENPEALATYLETYGEDDGWADLRQATGQGRAALALLLDRQQPIYRPPAWFAPLAGHAPDAVTRFCLENPPEALLLKAAGFFAAGICLTFALSIILAAGLPRDFTGWHPLDFARHGLLASVVLVSLIALSEPSLFAESAELPSRISIDLGPLAQAVDVPNDIDRKSMPDQITLLMLGIFFVLQVVLYLVCLIRVSHIRRLDAPAGLKMSLLENEDVLFDSGLYVGLGGTVASLIMVATSLVQAGLMAAYASTLFGILFVAILKIFHVRPYRRALLFDLQGGN
ncbi:MAG: hypothetical protein ACFB20_12520 [Opitutales bacterium]